MRPAAALVLLTGLIYGGWEVPFPAAIAQEQPQSGSDEEDWGGLPPGEGREEVFYTCQACHSLTTVLQQKLSREVWQETLVWMIEEQGMPEPDPDEYKRILDYLGTHVSPDPAQ